MTFQDWLQVLPYIGGALGVIAQGLLLLYNARVSARKASDDAETTNLQAAGNLSLDLAQKSRDYYADCMGRLDAMTRARDAALELNMQYYTALGRIYSFVDDLLRRHETAQLDTPDCEFAEALDGSLKRVRKEAKDALDLGQTHSNHPAAISQV